MQELIFTYEPKDYSNFNKDTLGVKRFVKYMLKVNAVPFVFISLCMALGFSFGLFGGIYLRYWLFDVILLVAFVVSYILACLFGLASQFVFGGKIIQRTQKGVCKDVKFTINDDVILFDNGSVQSTYQWSSIKDVYNQKYSLLIFIADVQAIVIPKRIFNSNDEIESCWKYLQDCYNNAQSSLK